MRSMEVTDEWLYQHMPVVDNARITALENRVDRGQLQCKIDRKTFVMQKVFLKFQQKLLTIKSTMLIL